MSLCDLANLRAGMLCYSNDTGNTLSKREVENQVSSQVYGNAGIACIVGRMGREPREA
jgi:hypothetical protein